MSVFETWPTLKTSSAPSERLAEIEVLRAVAILMVLVDHVPYNLVFWPSRFARSIYFGANLSNGVDLFFAISGFVIARSLLPRLAGITDWASFTRIAITFWIARAWRLLPSAWLWLTMPLLLCLIFNRSGAYESFSANWGMFVAGLLDLANFRVALCTGVAKPGTAFVQWSLSLEEQFYLLLPFAAFLLRRYLGILLAFIVMLGFIVPYTSLTCQLRLWPVACGVLLALWSTHPSYYDFAPTGLAKSRVARVGLFALLWASLASVGANLHIVGFYQGMVALISGGFVWISSYGNGYLWREGFARRVMETIAARSYSLYLVHIPVYFAAHEIWYRMYDLVNPNRHQAIAIVGLAVLATFGVAELNHRILEKPLRAHGKFLAAQYHARTALETV